MWFVDCIHSYTSIYHNLHGLAANCCGVKHKLMPFKAVYKLDYNLCLIIDYYCLQVDQHF